MQLKHFNVFERNNLFNFDVHGAVHRDILL